MGKHCVRVIGFCDLVTANGEPRRGPVSKKNLTTNRRHNSILSEWIYDCDLSCNHGRTVAECATLADGCSVIHNFDQTTEDIQRSIGNLQCVPPNL